MGSVCEREGSKLKPRRAELYNSASMHITEVEPVIQITKKYK